MEFINTETISELTDILLSNLPLEERIAFAKSQTHRQQQPEEDLTWADLDLTWNAPEPAARETAVGVPKDGQFSDGLFWGINTGAVLTSSADEQPPQHIAVEYHSSRVNRLYFDYEWVAEPSQDQRLTEDAVDSFDQAQHDSDATLPLLSEEDSRPMDNAIRLTSDYAHSNDNTHRIQPLAVELHQQQQPSNVDVPSGQQLPSEERIAFATSQQQQHDGDLTWADLDLDILDPAANETPVAVPTDGQFSNGLFVPSNANTQSHWIEPFAVVPNQQQQPSNDDGSPGQHQPHVSDTPFFNMTSSISHGSVMMSQPDVNSGYQFIGYPAVGAQLLNPTQQCQFIVQNPTVGTQLLQPVSVASALYQCPHAGCTKTFKTRTSIQRHVSVIHAGIKAHACDLCGQRFGQKTHLTAHLRKHTGEQPFACLLCDKAYKHNVDLRKHMTREHHIAVINNS